MKPLLDVLMILDALEKEGSFAAASAKLYKTPSALSYTVHKLESDLNIQLLDRSGHRAKFTRTGKMLLEKGREVLHTVRELEKQAIKLHEGWENELVIGVDDTFPFSLLAPLIEAFYQHHSVTRLKFINGAVLHYIDTDITDFGLHIADFIKCFCGNIDVINTKHHRHNHCNCYNLGNDSRHNPSLGYAYNNKQYGCECYYYANKCFSQNVKFYDLCYKYNTYCQGCHADCKTYYHKYLFGFFLFHSITFSTL
jgi:DNA-binding MarR family transcriptional regulator